MQGVPRGLPGRPPWFRTWQLPNPAATLDFSRRAHLESVRFWPGPTNKQEPICTLPIHFFFSSSSSLSGPSSLEKFLNVSTCPQCWEKFLLAWWWGHLGRPLSSLTTQSIPSLRSAPSSCYLRLDLKPSPKTC